MIARVLTVKSTTDWKVRIGGRRSSRPSRAARATRSCRATVRRCDWRAPLTGKELYLNGLNSGRMPSHAALAKAGSIAGKRGDARRSARSS